MRITVAAETARAYADACAFAEQADGSPGSSLDIVTADLEITEQQRDLGATSDFDVARAGAAGRADPRHRPHHRGRAARAALRAGGR